MHRGDGDGGRERHAPEVRGSVGKVVDGGAREGALIIAVAPVGAEGDGDREEEEDARDGDDRDGDEEEALHDEVVARVRAAARRHLLAGRAPHRPELAPTTVAAR